MARTIITVFNIDARFIKSNWWLISVRPKTTAALSKNTPTSYSDSQHHFTSLELNSVNMVLESLIPQVSWLQQTGMEDEVIL
jgi:hypothetical protein